MGKEMQSCFPASPSTSNNWNMCPRLPVSWLGTDDLTGGHRCDADVIAHFTSPPTSSPCVMMSWYTDVISLSTVNQLIAMERISAAERPESADGDCLRAQHPLISTLSPDSDEVMWTEHEMMKWDERERKNKERKKRPFLQWG